MDQEVTNALNNLAISIKDNSIAVYGFILPIIFGVFVAIWVIKWGYSVFIRGMQGNSGIDDVFLSNYPHKSFNELYPQFSWSNSMGSISCDGNDHFTIKDDTYDGVYHSFNSKNQYLESWDENDIVYNSTYIKGIPNDDEEYEEIYG